MISMEDPIEERIPQETRSSKTTESIAKLAKESLKVGKLLVLIAIDKGEGSIEKNDSKSKQGEESAYQPSDYLICPDIAYAG